MALPWLNPDIVAFPPVSQALTDPDGLLAAGGDLTPEWLLTAYRMGIFPWYEDGQPILWWSPNPRLVIVPGQLHISRSLRKILRKQAFRVTLDLCFERVISACAEPRAEYGGTWITEEMQAAYCQFHEAGFAHSVEVWSGDELVGGLYGIALGKVFFGESMFSRVSDASKVALAHLTQQLQDWGFELIDCQVSNPHLRSLGAREIPRESFQAQLKRLTPLSPHTPLASEPGPWQFDKSLSVIDDED